MKNPLRKVRSFFIKPMLTKLEMLKDLMVNNKSGPSVTLDDMATKDLKQIIMEQDLKIDELREMIVDLSSAFHFQNRISEQHLAKAAENVTPAVWKSCRPLLTLLTPKDIPNAKYIRIGRDADGGYILLDQLPYKGIVYSFGIGREITFDQQMAERNFDVFMYDHTINHTPPEHEKFHFFKIGITGSKPSKDLMTLEQILAKNGHQGRNDIILKMDVEGAEWDVFANCSQQVLMQFSQIVLELHGLTTLEPQKTIIPVLSRLNETHQLVHVHPNNYNPSAYHIFLGKIMPRLLEVTYVRKADHTFKPCNRFFPTPIDKPNLPDRPDIILGYYGKD